MTRKYNFSAGPAMLPSEVLKTAQAEMLNWQGTDMSVMEISHRSPAFVALCEQTEQLLRDLMHIPDNYQVLFLPGGARMQFAMVPLNLLTTNNLSTYVLTGRWSQLAAQEAEKYGQVHIVSSEKDHDFRTVPVVDESTVDQESAYCYYTPNETVHGVEFAEVPKVNVPLVADMTSCILSREYDVSQFGVIFAAAQKNLGQAGVTLVIIRDDLIQQPLPLTPSMFDYAKHREHHSLYNTAPTYAIYIMNLVLQDLQAKGGVPYSAKLNEQKSTLLYQHIDASDFYNNHVAVPFRSQMNVTFSLPNAELSTLFVAQAAEQSLYGLKGHSSVGGVRSSLYNAMPLAGVEALCDFMTRFAEEHANGK